jgi:hypothetical protein
VYTKPLFLCLVFYYFTKSTPKRTPNSTHFDQKNIQNLEFIPEGLTSLYGISSQTRTVTALSKDWYVYYKFIDDSTGKLKRMPNIKAGANRYKTKKATDSDPQGCFSVFTRKGLNPYSDPDLTLLNDEKTDSKQNEAPAIIKPQPEVVAFIEPEVIAIEEPIMTIKEAFEFALNIKKHSLNNTSYINFEGRINRFKKSFDESQPITLVLGKLPIST